jgi:hypothetical protein
MGSRAAASAAKEARLVIVSEMLLKGVAPTKIARATNVSPSQITHDKRQIMARWQKETAANIHHQREVVLRQNEWVLHEAVEAWQNSLEDRTKTTSKVVESLLSGQQRKEASKTVEGSDGNPAYLSIVENALRTKRELLGLDQPQTIESIDVNHHVAGNVVHTAIGLQETVDLLEQLANESDQGSLPSPVQVGPVLPLALGSPANGRGQPVDTGQMPGSADNSEREP